MLTHVVMFKFKKSASESVIAEVERDLDLLPGIIPEIKEFQLGADVSHSARSYDLVLISGFDNLEKLRHYDAHPSHQKVAMKIKDLCESVVTVDFESRT